MPPNNKPKSFRKRPLSPEPESEDEEERRLALEEVRFLQKQRERKVGIPALPTLRSVLNGSGIRSGGERGEGGGGGVDGEKEDLVLQDTFAQETAVTIEDPNMLKYVEQELAKKRGKNIESGNKEDKDPVDELYIVPEHLKVKKRNSEESSTQWTTGIAEIQLPIEYKLRNIEETEAAKKLLQEKRFTGKAKSELNIPSSFSADYFQRGRDYAEKLRGANCISSFSFFLFCNQSRARPNLVTQWTMAIQRMERKCRFFNCVLVLGIHNLNLSGLAYQTARPQFADLNLLPNRVVAIRQFLCRAYLLPWHQLPLLLRCPSSCTTAFYLAVIPPLAVIVH